MTNDSTLPSLRVLPKFPALLADWTDWDVSALALGKALGCFAPDAELHEHKHCFWTHNELGEGLFEVLDALVKVGVLESRSEPDLQFKCARAKREEGSRETSDGPAR